jgi:hypothetical protein
MFLVANERTKFTAARLNPLAIALIAAGTFAHFGPALPAFASDHEPRVSDRLGRRFFSPPLLKIYVSSKKLVCNRSGQ